MEKPLARTVEQAAEFVAVAEAATGMACVGHCMRFWPGWSWLKQAIDDGRFGRVLAATFRRVSQHPGGPFYLDGDRSGGAALDLHIHDADFVQYCFGMPRAVTSVGYAKLTNQPDHLITQYHYPDIPLVMAEGSWCMNDGFPFSMSFTVNFENATAVYDLAASSPLTLFAAGHAPQTIEIGDQMGYELEIDYFINCILSGTAPATVTIRDAFQTVQLVAAEVASVQSGGRVEVG